MGSLGSACGCSGAPSHRALTQPPNVAGVTNHDQRKRAPMARTKTGLSKFEGKDVASVTASIRNTGDGLSESMATDKVELHHGDEVFVVLRCLVEKIRHDPIKDSSALERVHMMKALDATIVDEELV